MKATTISVIGTTEITAPVFQSARLCVKRALFSNLKPGVNSCVQFAPNASDFECTSCEGSQHDVPPPTLGKQCAPFLGCSTDEVLSKPGAMLTAPKAGVNSAQLLRSSRYLPVS